MNIFEEANMEIKQKTIPLELKSLDKDGEFSGYGSIFGNKDSYSDIVMPGAFAKTLSECEPKDVKLLWQHDSRQPIGVYKEVREDSKGLYVKGQLCIDDVPKAKEAYGLLKMGAISGLSIGYMPNANGANYSSADNVTYLTSLKLYEVSLVTFPANVRANVESVKDFNDARKNVRDFENFLRDVGKYSKSEAKRIASRCFNLRDAEDANLEEDEEDEQCKQLLAKLSASILELNLLKGI